MIAKKVNDIFVFSDLINAKNKRTCASIRKGVFYD
jgi:hypothetical protein